MGFKGLLSFFMHRLVEILVAVLLITFMPSIPPDAKFSTPYTVTSPALFEGKLALNERLGGAELWHKGDLLGPEAFADYNGELYTSLHGGDVVKLTGNHITPVVKFGKPCQGVYQEKICGRPLGLNFDKTGALYVADAYYGIFKVDVKTGKKLQLVSMDQQIGGKKPKLCNSLVIAENGDLYWTDSSSEFSLENGLFDMLADGSGRLVHYDAKTKKNTVLIENIHFANGVELSKDEEFVIVSETARSRIHRYYLKGPKKGTSDIFIDGLPGIPDNLKADGQGGFFVPLVAARDADHPIAFQIFGRFPLVRKFLARVLGLMELGFKLVHQVYPNEYSERGEHFIGHFSSFSFLLNSRVSVLHVSKTGEIIDSWHATDKKIVGISEVHVFKDYLYLGSPFNDYIARVPLAKAGLKHLETMKVTKRAEESVPVRETTTTVPPTTTTTTRTTQAPPTTTTAKPTPAPTKAPTTTTTTPRPTTKPTTPPPTTVKPETPTRPPQKMQETTTAPPPTQAPTTKSPPPSNAPPKTAPVPDQKPPVKQNSPPSQELPKETARQEKPQSQQAPPPAKAAPSQSETKK